MCAAIGRMPRPLVAFLTLFVYGCATVPPEEAARRPIMWDAANECDRRFSTIADITGIDHYERLKTWCAPSAKRWIKQVCSPGADERVREMTSFRVR